MIDLRKLLSLVLALAISCLLTACGSGEAEGSPENAIAAQQEPEPPAEESPPEPTYEERVEEVIVEVPLSRLDLGEFPYFALPDGYRTEEQSFEWERTPYWVADGIHWVEGSVYAVAFFPDEKRGFSERSLREDIDYMITAVGGVKVSEVERIRMYQAQSHGLNDDVQAKFRTGLGRFFAYPVSTYLLRMFDADVWIHFTSFDRGANLMMAKAPPLRTPGGRLLSGVDLRNLLAQDGWVSLDNIHFDTGRSELNQQAVYILDEVVELLRFNPSLQLAIDGHADERGSAERNLLLSRDRSEAVRAALVERGITPDRLVSRGFGEHDPLADNTTEEGRAMNRRVSLAVIEEDDALPELPEPLREEPDSE